MWNKNWVSPKTLGTLRWHTFWGYFLSWCSFYEQSDGSMQASLWSTVPTGHWQPGWHGFLQPSTWFLFAHVRGQADAQGSKTAPSGQVWPRKVIIKENISLDFVEVSLLIIHNKQKIRCLNWKACTCTLLKVPIWQQDSNWKWKFRPELWHQSVFSPCWSIHAVTLYTTDYKPNWYATKFVWNKFAKNTYILHTRAF